MKNKNTSEPIHRIGVEPIHPTKKSWFGKKKVESKPQSNYHSNTLDAVNTMTHIIRESGIRVEDVRKGWREYIIGSDETTKLDITTLDSHKK